MLKFAIHESGSPEVAVLFLTTVTAQSQDAVTFCELCADPTCFRCHGALGDAPWQRKQVDRPLRCHHRRFRTAMVRFVQKNTDYLVPNRGSLQVLFCHSAKNWPGPCQAVRRILRLIGSDFDSDSLHHAGSRIIWGEQPYNRHTMVRSKAGDTPVKQIAVWAIQT